jgi:hypothetical protein
MARMGDRPGAPRQLSRVDDARNILAHVVVCHVTAPGYDFRDKVGAFGRFLVSLLTTKVRVWGHSIRLARGVFFCNQWSSDSARAGAAHLARRECLVGRRIQWLSVIMAFLGLLIVLTVLIQL